MAEKTPTAEELNQSIDRLWKRILAFPLSEKQIELIEKALAFKKELKVEEAQATGEGKR